MSDSHHDWSVNELFAPVWLDGETCACTEGVNKPFNAGTFVKLAKSTAFGTGGHPITQNVFAELKEMILGDDRCLHDRERTLGGPRILEVDAGSGVLLFLSKKLRPTLQAAAVVATEDSDTIERNRKKNKIRQLEIIPFYQFGSTHSYYNLHEKAFDLIFTQRGQECWEISFDATLAYLHHCLAPTGKLIYAGIPPAELPLAKHVFGEFFRVLKVTTHQDCPVLVGEHF